MDSQNWDFAKMNLEESYFLYSMEKWWMTCDITIFWDVIYSSCLIINICDNLFLTNYMTQYLLIIVLIIYYMYDNTGFKTLL